MSKLGDETRLLQKVVLPYGCCYLGGVVPKRLITFPLCLHTSDVSQETDLITSFLLYSSKSLFLFLIISYLERHCTITENRIKRRYFCLQVLVALLKKFWLGQFKRLDFTCNWKCGKETNKTVRKIFIIIDKIISPVCARLICGKNEW